MTHSQHVPEDLLQAFVEGEVGEQLAVHIAGHLDECPACAQFAIVTEPQVRERLVQTGQVRLRFFDYPIVDIHRNTLPAHLAAACAHDRTGCRRVGELLR